MSKVLFTATDLNGGTIQAGPFDALRLIRTSHGGGHLKSTSPDTAGEETVAAHVTLGPWKYLGTLELEDITITAAPETEGPVEEAAEEAPRKPKRKYTRKKRAVDVNVIQTEAGPVDAATGELVTE